MRFFVSLNFGIFLLLQFVFLHANSQNVGINEDGSAPDGSALLDLKSDSKGFLMPRMTKAERDLIASPVEGLSIYQTDNNKGYYYYDGSKWVGFGWLVTGNEGTDPTTNFFGTTDSVDLVGRTNDIERMRITAAGLMGVNNSSPSFELDVTGRINSSVAYLIGDTVVHINGGVDNISLGIDAGSNIGTASRLVFLGNQAGESVTTGSDNTLIGYQAGNGIETGGNNTIIGSEAGLNLSSISGGATIDR